jgi:hypothetical protein
MRDLRKLFLAALHPEMDQVDPDQFGTEMTAACDHGLDLRRANGFLIRIRIAKNPMRALSHRQFQRPLEKNSATTANLSARTYAAI